MSSDVTSQHVADSDTIEPDTITNVKQTSSGFVIRQYVVLSTDVLQPWVIRSYYKDVVPVVARCFARTPPADGVGATSERPACTELVERCAPSQLS